MFEKVVGRQAEARTEHFEVDAIVLLAYFFPRHLGVADRIFDRIGQHRHTSAHTELVAAIAVLPYGMVARPRAVKVEETGTAVLVVPDQSERGPQLQEVDGLLVLHEILLGNDPTHGTCREEPVALLRGEILGAVVTGVEIDQIAVLVSIGQTPHITHIGGRDVGILPRVVGLRLVVKQQCRHRVVTERTLVAEARLYIPVA